MPRKRIGPQIELESTKGGLAERLANELKSERESGQPIIYEQEYRTGKIRVTVVWDEWAHLPLEERTSIIFRAYEIAEGTEFRDRIALASGLTVPEATAAGLLTVQIIPAVRSTDPVTPEQVRQAMLEEGASLLLDPKEPRLRFASVKDAEAGKRRLIQRLPNSDPVWLIYNDIADQESVGMEEWAHVGND